MSEDDIKPNSPQLLFELLKSVASQNDPDNIDYSQLKYVIYARKSTTDDERQETSIPDQILDCLERVVGDPPQFNVIGLPIEEKGSAKEPDIRPLFRTMLDSVKAGRIDGIIAWHPDRLARNMKEAGEIIDLLDKGILKDLRFATSSFENSPTGKMLLGISFVLSKQYSEHLAEGVNRGNKRKTEKGVFLGKQKHGYYITKDLELYPDGVNFTYIQQAFQKRIEGISQPEIVTWLNKTGYEVHRKLKDPEPYKWDKDSVSKLLKDPVYAGVLRYGKQLVNLMEVYDFTPVISVEDFLKINKVTDLSSPKLISSMMVKNKDSTRADLLRGMVLCGYCGQTFSSGITSKELKSGKRYYYFYRCETENCEFFGKSVRAKVVLDDAIDFLSQYLFTTESNYEHYVRDAKEYISRETKGLNSTIASLTKQADNKDKEYERTKNLIRDNPGLAEHYDLSRTKQELKAIQKDMKGLIKQRADIKQSIFTYEQYLELFENIGSELRSTHDMSLLDQNIRKFFSNFTVKSSGSGKKQIHDVAHKLNEPWNGFIKTNNFERGRDDRT